MLSEIPSALEAVPAIRAIRVSPVLYPAVNGAHILSFSALVGAIMVYDIQVIRRRVSPSETALSVARWGFLFAVATGTLLFACAATRYVENPAAWLKVGLLAAALMNILAFHAVEASSETRRQLAMVSLLLWPATLFAGRWIGFV